MNTIVDLEDGLFVSKVDYDVVVQIMSEDGERGRDWIDQMRYVTSPCDIWDRRIKYLNLSLPPIIDKLTKLEELHLSSTPNLRFLPESIGNMISLKRLSLDHSGITFLTPAIGRLQNLEFLDITDMESLSELPKEIWTLARLKTLMLCVSKNKFLAGGWGRDIKRLPKLESLFLYDIEKLSDLPKEILNLKTLKRLDLSGRGINKAVTQTAIMVHGCPSLVTLGDMEEELNKGELGYALACNRAKQWKFRAPLWPLALAKAIRAFYAAYYNEYDIQQPDAIFQLLLLNRESFLGIFINRDNTKRPAASIASPEIKRRKS